MAKILVVDDSKFSRIRTIEPLRRAGHEVFEAPDGAVGLEMVATHGPDCVLLDMLMPVLDGTEFLRRLRASGSNLPVVVITADIQSSTHEICERLGVSGFAQKPACGEDICRLVEHALAGEPGRSTVRLNADQEDAIREIFSIGIGRAAATLSELLGTRIEMTVPHLTLRLLDVVAEPEVTSPASPEVVVVQDFRGVISGRSALSLPHASALRLAQLLGEVAEPVDELDLEMSGILTEVGNIMLNSVLGVIANMIDTHLVYTVPHFCSARPVSLLLSQGTQDLGALLTADADFWVRHDSIQGSLLVATATCGIEAILDAICKVES